MSATKSGGRRASAGLPLSVGGAPVWVRVLLAAIFLCTGAICIAAAVFLALDGSLPALAIAAMMVMPLGAIACIAAAFVVAPYSRFGVGLDAFAGALNGSRALLLFVVTAIVCGAILFAVR